MFGGVLDSLSIYYNLYKKSKGITWLFYKILQDIGDMYVPQRVDDHRSALYIYIYIIINLLVLVDTANFGYFNHSYWSNGLVSYMLFVLKKSIKIMDKSLDLQINKVLKGVRVPKYKINALPIDH